LIIGPGLIAIVGAWRRGRATADARVPAGD